MSQQVIANRFEMGSFLAGGGMGDVFRGIDRTTDQPVAIKVLKPEIVAQDADQLQRFAREGELLAKLNHPNIVKVIKMVEEEGRNYIVMEYVGGGTLRDLLIEQPQLPLDRVMEIALDLADALTRAHRLNIVHRDLKPANVLIAEDGTPRLTDFGLAWQAGSELTQTGMVMGTSSYLSPEAISGHQLDARSDIWAFGVMLFEMLAGRRPFNEEIQAALLFAIMSKPAPPLRQFRPDAPEAIANLIQRMLEKDPDQRVPSVRQVGADLEAIISGSKSSAIQAQAGYVPPKTISVGQESRFGTPTPSMGFPEIQVQFTTPTPLQSQMQPSNVAPPAPVQKSQPRLFIGAFIGVLLIILGVLVGVILVLSQEEDDNSNNSGNLPTVLSPDNNNAQQPQMIRVDPVREGEYLVLVAGLESIGGPGGDISRLIMDDLRQKFETDVPFSNIHVRPYPIVITSPEQAGEAARFNNAQLIIWGNFDQNLIQVEIQLGVPANFPNIQLPPEELAELVNLRVEMTDARQQSVAPMVVAAFGILQFVDGNGYGTAVSLSVAEEIGVEDMPEIVGTSVAADYYRYLLSFSDFEVAYAAITRAIEARRSPILYGARGTLLQRMGEERQAEAQEDVNTARLLANQEGLDKWAIPDFLDGLAAVFNNDLAAATEDNGKAAELRPNDWFPVGFQSVTAYFSGDYATAKTSSAKSITLNPTTNIPHIIAVLLALREGHIEEMGALIQDTAREFPDPTFSVRTLNSVYGPNSNFAYTWFSAAAANLFLGQFNVSLQHAETAININDAVPEVYMIQGLAYCNLGQYAEAETAYSRAIELDPEFTALYVLRADVRRKLENVAGTLEDVTVVNQSDLADEFRTYLERGATGDFGCQNIAEGAF